MTVSIKKKIFLISIFLFFLLPLLSQAQVINIDASKLVARVELKFSPRAGSFEEGSTFQVPILLDTKGQNINGIEVHVNFDKDKLAIVNPTGGTSIIGVWVEPPKFDNTRGTASYVGVVPNGIVTNAGLIGTITFQAKAPGAATVFFGSNSKVLLNDGLGTEAQTDLGRADYTILTKAPDGVQVFSETHPIQSNWYNNNTPVLSWIKDPGVNGFSFELDNKPNTIPDNTIDTEETTKSFDTLSDGLWYFHIKASKDNTWGTTGHFLVRIDTTPPAQFTPQTNYLVAAVVLAERTLVSFFTTDNLSGVDHYEVGIIDKSQPPTESPVFIQTESPFQVPLSQNGNLEVIVRAVDKAGNVRDESIAVHMPFVITKFIKDYIVYILIGIILLGFIILILHYLIGHHIIRTIGNMRRILRKEKVESAQRILAEERGSPPQDRPYFPERFIPPVPPAPVPRPAPRIIEPEPEFIPPVAVPPTPTVIPNISQYQYTPPAHPIDPVPYVAPAVSRPSPWVIDPIPDFVPPARHIIPEVNPEPEPEPIPEPEIQPPAYIPPPVYTQVVPPVPVSPVPRHIRESFIQTPEVDPFQVPNYSPAPVVHDISSYPPVISSDQNK